MDLSADTDYRIVRNEDGKEVLVILPDVAWDAVKRWGDDNMLVLSGFKAEALSGGGVQLRLLGKDKISVHKEGVLAPQYGRGYRLYIDLVSD